MRLIVKYERREDVRFISQLDILRTVHRALRRADIPVAYSEGFNPQPKVSFGFALSVGLISYGEYMDIHLTCDISPETFISSMNAVMPKGIVLTEAALAGEKTPKMGKMIDCAKFETIFNCENADIFEAKLNDFFGRDSIVIERHTKKGTSQADVKNYVYFNQTEIIDGTHVKLVTIQALSEEMSVRIDDIVSAIANYADENVIADSVKKDTLLRYGDKFITPVEYTRITKSE